MPVSIPHGNSRWWSSSWWDRNNMEAVNILVQALSSAHTSYVVNQTSTKGTWKKLEDVNRECVLEKRSASNTNWTRSDRPGKKPAVQQTLWVESLTEHLRYLNETLEDVDVAAIAIQGHPKSYCGVVQSLIFVWWETVKRLPLNVTNVANS